MQSGAMKLLVGASLFALGTPAWGESAPKAPADVQEVIVTGSRIMQSGYERPTPVTVVTAEQLNQAQPAGISQALTELPQFLNSQSPRMTAGQTASASRGTYLNLRNLGANRNLVLLDGARVPPTTAQGLVDVDILPELLVQRVDVVTAGVSAVYGSDAVTGVVNYILDKNFEGFRGVVQAGVSTYDDGGSSKVGLAMGHAFLDGRAHVLLSYEHEDSAEVQQYARKYVDQGYFAAGALAGAAGTASNPYVFFANAGSVNSAPNGIIVSGLPGFTGVTFTPTGQVRPYDPGKPAGPSAQVGGDSSQFPINRTLIYGPREDRLFGRISYDLTPGLNIFAQLMASETHNPYNNVFGSIRGAISPDNPFLPPEALAAIAANRAAGGNGASAAATTACGFGSPVIGCYTRRIIPELGLGHEIENVNSFSYRLGASGDLFDGWKFDANYIYGRVKQHVEQQNDIQQAHVFAALDSVRDPATGQIVCRVNLITPGYAPGCVPFNPFNISANSPAALDYLRGTSTYDVRNVTNDFVVNVTGEPFHTWAGPVGVAIGGEYRNATLDEDTNSDPSVKQPIANIRAANPNTAKFSSLNTGLAHGQNNVKEANIEALVPLARDLPFARSLTVTGAYRYTDYSNSGGARTWKIGGTWEPVEDLRFRLTKSRDIRAPTLFDLYAGTTNTRTALTDPHCNCGNINGGTNVLGGGNPDLKPEVGSTLTYGVILQPRWIPRFTASIDYYDLKLTNAITQLSGPQVLQQCEDSGGTAPICANINRPFAFSDHSATNAANSVFAGSVNAALVRTKGIDIEATYRIPVQTWKLDGELTFHFLGNYVAVFNQKSFPADTIHPEAGFTGSGFTPLITDAAIPRFQGSLSGEWRQGPLSLFLRGRMISEMKTGPKVYAVKTLPAQYYTDVTATYTIRPDGKDVELFATVNNLFNQTAPLFPNNVVEGYIYPTIQSLYDVMGRYYTGGVRFKF